MKTIAQLDDGKLTNLSEATVLTVVSDYLYWIVENFPEEHRARIKFYEREYVNLYLRDKINK